jgi:AbrB family looped-hinge helix DNA binding protein
MRAHSIVSSKRQIVIPANLRKRYGLKEGTTVVFEEDRGRLVLEPSNHAAIYALQGSLADFPLEEDLAEERQAEQKREADGERMSSGRKRGAPLLRCQRRAGNQQGSCTFAL